MQIYYILKAQSNRYFCRWSDSAEIYYSYLKSIGTVELITANILPESAEELIIDDFVINDFKHYQSGGRELIEGTIEGTINIRLRCEVSRYYTVENEWYISNEYYLINDVRILGEYSSTIREIITEQIRELESHGYLETTYSFC